MIVVLEGKANDLSVYFHFPGASGPSFVSRTRGIGTRNMGWTLRIVKSLELNGKYMKWHGENINHHSGNRFYFQWVSIANMKQHRRLSNIGDWAANVDGWAGALPNMRLSKAGGSRTSRGFWLLDVVAWCRWLMSRFMFLLAFEQWPRLCNDGGCLRVFLPGICDLSLPATCGNSE